MAGDQGTNSSVSQLVLENVTVVGNGNRTGGLIGFARGVISKVGIKNLNLNGQDLVGGLIGSLDNSEIQMSYSIGKVYGTNEVGGLAGRIKNYSKIINSYSKVNLNLPNENIKGGLVGKANHSNKIKNSYALQKLVGALNNTIHDNTTNFYNNPTTSPVSLE